MLLLCSKGLRAAGTAAENSNNTPCSSGRMSAAIAVEWATMNRTGEVKGNTMAIQIGAKPDSGFDDPIGMLKDCHRRIESFLGILCVVVDRAQGRSLTDEERDAVKAALQYFRTGGQRHTADEEESLFPRLRKSDAKSFEEIDRLEDDHREANNLHSSVERLYSVWIESGSLSAENTRLLLSETARLKQLYSAHIEVEEKIVFARASQILDTHAIAAIGTEFRFRRK
jgi:hemerythrin-like domain-containing protein